MKLNKLDIIANKLFLWEGKLVELHFINRKGCERCFQKTCKKGQRAIEKDPKKDRANIRKSVPV